MFGCTCQVDEVMLTLKQAFTTAVSLQSNNNQIQLCEACPMHDLHKLCERIEGKPPEFHHTASLLFGFTHKYIDARAVSESWSNKKKDHSYILLYFQVSTHLEQR